MWKDIKIVNSTDENVRKYVFTTEDAVAESVLYKYPTYEDRTVICCSTQSGCPIGCRFCGAGDYFVRNLSIKEIIQQPIKLIEDTGLQGTDIKKLQIMFMSMGEPMLNLKSLDPAIRILHWMYPNAALLVSSSAPKIDYENFHRLSRDVPTVGLQFSVHESTDEARNRLIPFKAKLSLKEIAFTGEEWNRRIGRKPFFNYCVHPENNTDLDVDRLHRLFNPEIWNATLSVICERNESVAAANERQRELASTFASKMLERGYNVRVFNPAGQDDIGGGCGQLWYVQSWMREHPEMIRKSIGYGLEKVHTPCA